MFRRSHIFTPKTKAVITKIMSTASADFFVRANNATNIRRCRQYVELAVEAEFFPENALVSDWLLMPGDVTGELSGVSNPPQSSSHPFPPQPTCGIVVESLLSAVDC